MQTKIGNHAIRAKQSTGAAWMPALDPASGELRAGDRKQLFAHGEALQSLHNQASLVDCLDDLRRWIDVSGIVVAAGTVNALSDMRSAGSGDDPRWRDLYLRERFVLVDPIVHKILHGQRFVDRACVMAENEVTPGCVAHGTDAATTRAMVKRPTLNRFGEAVHDHNRPGFGFAIGTRSRGCIALCSVTVSSPSQRSQRPAVLLRALRPVLHEALVRIMLPARTLPRLSVRELSALECLANGHSDTEIADIMAISESTVRFHLGNVFDKLGARNRCHAVSIGFQSGLLQR